MILWISLLSVVISCLLLFMLCSCIGFPRNVKPDTILCFGKQRKDGRRWFWR